MVQIILCGIATVEKLELFNAVKSSKDVCHLPNLPRMVAQKHGVEQNNSKVPITLLHQKSNIMEQMKREEQLKQKQKYDGFISDGGVLDSIAYVWYYIGEKAARDLMTDPKIRASLESYQSSMIVLVSPLSQYDDITKSALNSNQIEMFTEIFKNLIDEHKIPYLNLKCVDPHERVKTVVDAAKGKQMLSYSSLSYYENISSKKGPVTQNASVNGKSADPGSVNIGFYITPNSASKGLISIPTVVISEHEIEQKWTTSQKGEVNRFIHRHGMKDLFIIEFHRFIRSSVVQKILSGDLKINGLQYSFLGCSASGLKIRKCYLLKGTQKDAESAINENGDFYKLTSVSKKMARISLLFSAVKLTNITVKEDKIVEEEDIENPDGACFTDGCGGISVELAKKLYQQAKDSSVGDGVLKSYLPAVYQVRYQGLKGVLALDKSLKGLSIKVRPSMEKFHTTHHPFIGVCGYSKPYTFGHLNQQYIMLLSGLGVPDHVFEQKQQTHFKLVQTMDSDPKAAITMLQWQNKFEMAEKVVEHTKAMPENSEVRKCISSIQQKLVSESGRLRIIVPNSRNIYGACDPTGHVLDYGECFVRVTIDGVPVTLQGQVVVSKNPCYLLGDVRVLKAVNYADKPDVKKFDHLVDCIVYPSQGKRPHPNEIAGSDLDGDMYFVTWDEDLIPPKIAEPYDYPGAKAKPDGAITMQKMISYFSIQNQALNLTGKVDSYFKKWANHCGVSSTQCERLGQLFSRVIDAAKTGERITIPPGLIPPPEPSKVCEPKYIWRKMVKAAEAFECAFKERVINGQHSLTADDVEFEFVKEILKQNFSNVTEYSKLNFAWKHALSLLKNKEDALEMVLNNYVDDINFGLFTAEERKVVIEKGIPSKFVQNALNKSCLLSPENLRRFKMDDSSNKWKFFFRYSHDTFDWPYLIDALTHHDKTLVVVKLPDQVTIVLQFQERCKIGEQIEINPGTISACLFSENFHYQMYYILGAKYTMDLTDESMQLYRQEKINTFLWLKLVDGKIVSDEIHNAISVDLTRFNRNILRNQRRHPLVRKTPFTTIEVFVQDDVVDVSYLDTVEINYLEPVPEKETSLGNEDADNEIDFVSLLFNDLVIDIPEDCEQLKNLLHQAAEQTSLTLFHKIMPKWKQSWDSGDFISSLVGLLENILQKITPSSLPQEIQDSLCSLIIYGIENLKELECFVKLITLLCRLHMDDVVKSILHKFSDLEISLDNVLDIFMEWKYWSFIDAGKAKKMVDCIYKKCTENLSDSKSNYVLYFAKLQILAMINEMVTTKQEELISKLKVDTYPEGTDVEVPSPSLSSSSTEFTLYKTGATRFRSRLGNGQFLAMTKQVDHDLAHFFIVQVIAFTVAPLSITLRMVSKTPDTLIECLNGNKIKYWKLNHLANVISFTRIMDALKKLLVPDPPCTDLAPVLFQPAGHPNNSPLYHPGDFSIPEAEHVDQPMPLNINVELNEMQKEAVLQALRSKLTLIQGPPGTGKTTVACAIVLKLYQMKTCKQILVCAETNMAVDNIAKRLDKLSDLVLVRVGSDDLIDKELFDISLEGQIKNLADSEGKRASFQDKKGMVHRNKKLAKRILSSADVVLTTCSSAGDQTLSEECFEFVLVDEATLTMETTLLCALVHGAKQLVLIGDPRQLGPFAVSKDGAEEPLSTTLFHRLFNVMPCSFLDTQHRMHPALMDFPSTEFYDGKLKSAVKPADRMPLECFPWPDPKCPICFVNVDGWEKRVGTSYCNYAEQEAVMIIVDILFDVDEESRDKLMQNNVAIITFYQGQVVQIRNRLMKTKFSQFEVNSIDGFQGRESEVIIVSAVRSNYGGSLGFTDDKNRFNVMLTRARSALIVVGNKQTLESSEMWQAWLQQAKHCTTQQLLDHKAKAGEQKSQPNLKKASGKPNPRIGGKPKGRSQGYQRRY